MKNIRKKIIQFSLFPYYFTYRFSLLAQSLSCLCSYDNATYLESQWVDSGVGDFLCFCQKFKFKFGYFAGFQTLPRACLKIAFCKILTQFASSFMLNFGDAVGYIDEIQHESWCEAGQQIAGINFQARPKAGRSRFLPDSLLGLPHSRCAGPMVPW